MYSNELRITTAGNGDDQEMEEDAEAVDSDHVREGKSRGPRHVPGRGQRDERSDKCEQAERLLALFFIDEWIEDHHYDSEDGEDQFGQNSDIVHALRDRLQQQG